MDSQINHALRFYLLSFCFIADTSTHVHKDYISTLVNIYWKVTYTDTTYYQFSLSPVFKNDGVH